MSCSGLHCAGCGGGAGVPVVLLLALEGGAWVAAHLVEVAVTSAACGVLAVAAVIWLMRWADRRDARLAARGPLWAVRAGTAPLPQVITARPAPQVTHAPPPAIETHYHVHHHYAAAPEPARVITTASPATAGDITEGETDVTAHHHP